MKDCCCVSLYAMRNPIIEFLLAEHTVGIDRSGLETKRAEMLMMISLQLSKRIWAVHWWLHCLILSVGWCFYEMYRFLLFNLFK